MAERLTEYDSHGDVYVKYHDYISAAEKLARYEDLEEQGRLVILPEDEEKVQAMNEKLLELTDIAEAALKGAEE